MVTLAGDTVRADVEMMGTAGFDVVGDPVDVINKIK